MTPTARVIPPRPLREAPDVFFCVTDSTYMNYERTVSVKPSQNGSRFVDVSHVTRTAYVLFAWFLLAGLDLDCV